MKLSVLDEILEENFTQTLEKNSPDTPKSLTAFVGERNLRRISNRRPVFKPACG